MPWYVLLLLSSVSCVQFFFFVSNPVATQIKNGVVASAVATFSGGSRFSFT